MVRDRKTQSSDEGIALVIVLGILSILLILGVAFATALRTEELATRNSVDSIRAKQLIDLAMAQAMEKIDSERDVILGDNPADFFMTSPTQNPADRVIRSSGSGGDYGVSNFLIGSAAHFLRADESDAVRDAATSDGHPQWVPITIPSGGAAPDLRGQIAFIAVDVSDYIDANFAGEVTRDLGTNVGEVALWGVDSSDWPNFSSDRSTEWGEFDTYSDIEMLAGGSYLQQKTNHFLQPYSLFPSNYYWNSSIGRETNHFDITSAISGSNVDTNMIVEAIAASGMDFSFATNTNRAMAILAANIRDYLDSDNIPGNNDPAFSMDYGTRGRKVRMATVCTEKVPMVNEVQIIHRMAPSGSGPNGETIVRSLLEFQVELWYPFPGTPPNSIDVVLGLGVGPVNPPALNYRFAESLSRAPGAAAPGYIVYHLNNPTKQDVTVQLPPPLTQPGFSATFGIVDVSVRVGGQEVDHLYFEVEDWSTTLFEADWKHGQLDKQVTDPRINWDWDDNAQWWPSPFLENSLGQENPHAAAVYSVADGDTVMFVRNGLYRSPGELGQLLYDENRPWHTIRLLGPDPDRTASLVEHFAYPAGDKGFVNLNSGIKEVLASAFVGSPVRRLPDDPRDSSPLLSEADALNVADKIIQNGVNSGMGREFENRANLAVFVTAADIVGASGKISDQIDAENVISDAYGLLGTRQNLFTVFAIAQIFAPKSQVVVAERRAVALVWRDPLPNRDDPDGQDRHAAFVRNLVWLND